MIPWMAKGELCTERTGVGVLLRAAGWACSAFIPEDTWAKLGFAESTPSMCKWLWMPWAQCYPEFNLQELPGSVARLHQNHTWVCCHGLAELATTSQCLGALSFPSTDTQSPLPFLPNECMPMSPLLWKGHPGKLVGPSR